MRQFYADIAFALEGVEVEDHGYGSVFGYLDMVRQAPVGHAPRLIFIGNGGSAAIASHMAADYQKNGGFSTLCFNDAASLTCISNDIGYESVFRHPLSHHGRIGDVLFAISSSGESESILEAVDLAKRLRLNVVTLSGFIRGNRLRGRGGANFYVPSMNYGVVENVHMAILHGFLDELMKREEAKHAID
jgi:D-sedoheptulose 7-phosphate isomerase